MEKYRAYLGSAPFKLRVDNCALAWLKTYSMDQSYIGRCIVLDKETYDELPLTSWLDKLGHPIPGQPEFPVDKNVGIKMLRG